MKLTKSKLREIIQEVIDEIEEEEQDVDEATTTGNVSGYQTPNAFSTSDEPDDEYVDRLNRSTGYKRVNEDIDIVDKKFNIGKVTDSTGDDWYVKKIDSTHMFMANDPKYLKKDKPTGVMAHHIGQHRDAIYYKDLKKWLKSTNEINESAKVSDWTRLDKEEQKEYKNRWLELKNSDQTPNQKIGIGVREIRRELAEMEKFVNWYSRIRSMNELGKDDYWKRTQRHLKKIKERLIGFANKIQELDKPLGE